MKKMTALSVLATIVLAGIYFEFLFPLPTQARAPSEISTSGYGVWRINFGITPDQKARFTVANLSTGRNDQLLAFQCSFFDRNGTRVFTSARTEVSPTKFGQFELAYGDLVMDSEAGTERKQVRLEMIIVGSSASSSTTSGGVWTLLSSGVDVSGEILNGATGTTNVWWQSPPLITVHADDPPLL